MLLYTKRSQLTNKILILLKIKREQSGNTMHTAKGSGGGGQCGHHRRRTLRGVYNLAFERRVEKGERW